MESSAKTGNFFSPTVIEFWCVGLPVALRGGGGWMAVVGAAPDICACAHMHTHTHACMVNIISCKWLPPLGESMGIPYDVICTCACVCAHVWGHSLTTPTPIQPPPTPIHPCPYPPGGATPGIGQNSIALELI